MSFVVLLAIGLLLRTPIPVLLILWVSLSFPMFAALVGGGVVATLLARGARQDAEVAVLTAVASELRAGRSLRDAIGSVAQVRGGAFRGVARRASLGVPLAHVATELEAQLPHQGRLAGVAVRLSSNVGVRAADVFESLAVLAADEGEVRREGRTGSAAARLSAWIIGGVPVGLVAWQIASGGMLRTLLLPLGLPIVLGGLGLVAAGGAIVVFMTRKASL